MSQMLKSIAVLIFFIVVTHLIYIGLIRPEAAILIEAAKEAGQSSPRDLFVILKDYEQEICIILMGWGVFLIISKCLAILKDRYLFTIDLLEASSTDSSSLEGALISLEELPENIRKTSLVTALTSSLLRFSITKDVQNTSDAIESSMNALALKQEAENSMIRYLIWAIPSIGFIGTVRGIGQALSQADQALAGDISGMTDSLGVAFNSTFVALLISIFLMFSETYWQGF